MALLFPELLGEVLRQRHLRGGQRARSRQLEEDGDVANGEVKGREISPHRVWRELALSRAKQERISVEDSGGVSRDLLAQYIPDHRRLLPFNPRTRRDRKRSGQRRSAAATRTRVSSSLCFAQMVAYFFMIAPFSLTDEIPTSTTSPCIVCTDIELLVQPN
ncbi:hypothetical protein [Sorangium sp. So ce887]|uniref:hypothetical protein n=1 Tax=Sorangium sp. So ce887 TaxID=3133324 RepID=UPI003F6074B0